MAHGSALARPSAWMQLLTQCMAVKPDRLHINFRPMPAQGFGEVEVVQLGDVIDGCNAKMNASETALAAVLNVLSRPDPPSQLW